VRPALLFLVLFLLPAAHATWYYAGDTFTQDGVLYSVEGSDESLVLLGVSGRTFLVRLGECIRNGLAEYCYVDTAYPDDDDHIKYEAGAVYYGYDLSIGEVAPAITVTRELSTEEPFLNQDVTVTVTLENTGEYRITDIRYDEALPAGVTGVGTAVSNRVSYTKTALSAGYTDRFTYRVRPVVYGTFTLAPIIRYTSEGVVFNASVSSETIEVASPVDIDRYVTPALGLEEVGTYALNVTNDQGGDVQVQIVIGVPAGVTVTQASGLAKQGSSYTASGDIGDGETLRFSFSFTAGGPGSYVIPLAVTTVKDGVTSTLSYNDTVDSTADGIAPSIGISPVKTTYPGGSQATITAVLTNENDEVGFRKAQGAFSSDLFGTKTRDQGALGAGDDVTLFTERVTLPNVTNQTTYAINLTGSYETVNGQRFTFSTSRQLTVIPLVRAVEITRALSSATIAPGGNVTVTVSAKNVYGTYIAIDAHEKLPVGVENLGGLTYAEVSIDKDATKQLYIYQIGVPADYADDTIALTTVTRVQGESEPQEFTTALDVAGAGSPQELADGDAADAGVEEASASETDTSDDGFFARLWSRMKGWFS